MNKMMILVVLMGMVLSHPLTARTDAGSAISAYEDSLKTDPQNTRLLLSLGNLYFSAGAAGNKKAVAKAEAVYKKVLALEPANAAARCRYGSVLTLKGRDALLPFNKLRHVNNGLKEMDKAIALSPDDVNIRMTRGNTCLRLPDIFNRIDTAIVDFEHLIALSQKTPDKFNNNLLSKIYLMRGLGYKKKGDINKAHDDWNKVVELAQDSEEGKSAKELLGK